MTYSTNDRIRLIDAQAEHNLSNKTTVFGRMADEIDALTTELGLRPGDEVHAPIKVNKPGQTRFQAMMALTQDDDRPRSGDVNAAGQVFDPEIGEFV